MKVKQLINYYKGRLGGKKEVQKIRLKFPNSKRVLVEPTGIKLYGFNEEDLNKNVSFVNETDLTEKVSTLESSELIEKENQVLVVELNENYEEIKTENPNILNFVLNYLKKEKEVEQTKVFSHNLVPILELNKTGINFTNLDNTDQENLDCACLIVREKTLIAIK